MNNYEVSYQALINEILLEKNIRPTRTGIVFSSFSKNIEHNLVDGFPMLTGKKMFFKNIIHEFIWIVSGETSIKYLIDNNVNIWNKWADKELQVGHSYGYQMRKFNGQIDQLKYIINNIRSDKYSRRHIINLWNPLQLSSVVLPPCYYTMQFYIDKKDIININVFMRSADVFIGLPYDVSVLSLLLITVASEVNMQPGIIKFNITDCHIYYDHLDCIYEYMQNKLYELPKLDFNGNLFDLKGSDFQLINYSSNKYINSPVSK